MRNIEFEWLPAYAPELNPVESRWSHTKYSDLANFVPDDTPRLKRAVRKSLKAHSEVGRLSSCGWEQGSVPKERKGPGEFSRAPFQKIQPSTASVTRP